MEFYEHLASYLSQKEIINLKEHLQDKSLHAALINPFLMNDEKFLSLFPNVKKHPIVDHAYIYDNEEYDLGKSIYHELGCFYLQEPSAMVPAFLLNVEQSDIVLDLCAAPGGKSIQCSFRKNNNGVIISNDISKERCKKIVENINRLGIGNIAVANNDFSKIYDNFIDYFDKIILDAPCSGSGMFRKNENIKNDWTYNKVLKYQSIQKELITICYKMLKPGGTLCYSTCSLSFEEDDEIAKFLIKNTDAIIENIKDNPLFYKAKDGYGVHLLPSIFPGEGQYICLFKKPINEIETKNKNFKIKNKFINPLFKLIPFDVNYCDAKIFNSKLYLYPIEFDLKNLYVIQPFLEVGKINKEIEKYSYQFARYIKNSNKEIELDLKEAEKIINGESLNLNMEKGIYLLKFDNYPICFSKSDGRIIKNWYYKPIYPKKY